MDELRRGLCAYLKQQAEWQMPDVVLTSGLAASLAAAGAAPGPRGRNAPGARAAAPAAAPRSSARAAAPRKPSPAMFQRMPIAGLGRAAEAAAARTPAGPGGGPKRDALKALYFEVKGCTACPLSARRKSMVFGSGNAEAEIMVIGEAPGADEDVQGRPFVGRAGQLLTEMLAAIGLDRTRDVFITNVLKCRPPDNRDPESAEEAQCMPILRRQIAVIRPKVLLLLGRVAARALLGQAASIGSLRGRTHTCEGVPAFVTYHPAALLRSPEYKRPAWEDLKRLAAFVAEQGIRHGNGS